ncbi:uncharacterized protein MONOS_10395 [Monocercomonoides exilis]|uniref:uncharacterized protein n=1 Tax=Monocercomonoides exilis TaxID=2049356 RepID=UPI00355A246A|nr:hypothetical protein MONOS_10395 [Monocercomonoides exilis]|eukprot:MONOS_10395.1-p1 / transcript=MONOS_10395.1 / gene=MONOS_10395 / organism=Monocercomonoides_exilis_PA203 / gene_product=unspecified product / transcript_product=unspecified product / location=Mono_scaffold00472:11365-14080(+) / protein_length=821 / sequence_SO=supercontig / SO=protein_coding / is_pseudo=false
MGSSSTPSTWQEKKQQEPFNHPSLPFGYPPFYPFLFPPQFLPSPQQQQQTQQNESKKTQKSPNAEEKEEGEEGEEGMNSLNGKGRATCDLLGQEHISKQQKNPKDRKVDNSKNDGTKQTRREGNIEDELVAELNDDTTEEDEEGEGEEEVDDSEEEEDDDGVGEEREIDKFFPCENEEEIQNENENEMQYETSENKEEFRGEDETDRTKEEEKKEEFQEGKQKSVDKKTFVFGFDSQLRERMAFEDRLEEERRWKEEKERLDEAGTSEATDFSQKQQKQGDFDEKRQIPQHSNIFESRKRQKAPGDRAFGRNSVFLTSYSRLASASSGLAIPSASENGRGKEGKEGRRTYIQVSEDDINHFSSSSVSSSSSSLQSPHLHKTHSSPRSSLHSVEDPVLSMTLPSHSGSELLRMKEKQQQTTDSSSTSSSPSSSSFNSSSISPLEDDAFFRAVKHHSPPADLFFCSQREKESTSSSSSLPSSSTSLEHPQLPQRSAQFISSGVALDPSAHPNMFASSPIASLLSSSIKTQQKANLFQEDDISTFLADVLPSRSNAVGSTDISDGVSTPSSSAKDDNNPSSSSSSFSSSSSSSENMHPFIQYSQSTAEQSVAQAQQTDVLEDGWMPLSESAVTGMEKERMNGVSHETDEKEEEEGDDDDIVYEHALGSSVEFCGSSSLVAPGAYFGSPLKTQSASGTSSAMRKHTGWNGKGGVGGDWERAETKGEKDFLLISGKARFKNSTRIGREREKEQMNLSSRKRNTKTKSKERSINKKTRSPSQTKQQKQSVLSGASLASEKEKQERKMAILQKILQRASEEQEDNER